MKIKILLLLFFLFKLFNENIFCQNDLLSQASHAYNVHKFELAIMLCDSILKKDNNNFLADSLKKNIIIGWRKHADGYYNERNYNAALIEYKAILNVLDNLEIIKKVIPLLMFQNDTTNLTFYYSLWQKNEPENGEIHRSLAYFYEKNKNWEKACFEYKKATELDSTDTLSKLGFVKCYNNIAKISEYQKKIIKLYKEKKYNYVVSIYDSLSYLTSDSSYISIYKNSLAKLDSLLKIDKAQITFNFTSDTIKVPKVELEIFYNGLLPYNRINIFVNGKYESDFSVIQTKDCCKTRFKINLNMENLNNSINIDIFDIKGNRHEAKYKFVYQKPNEIHKEIIVLNVDSFECLKKRKIDDSILTQLQELQDKHFYEPQVFIENIKRITKDRTDLLADIYYCANKIDSSLIPIIKATEGISWAIVIGINNYSLQKGFFPLRYAVKDAKSIRKILQERYRFPEKNIIELYDENATKREIEKEFIKVSKNSVGRLLIYFSGHGTMIQDNEGNSEGLLVPVDGDTADYLGSCILKSDIEKYLRLFNSHQILIIVDACYSGAIGEKGESELLSLHDTIKKYVYNGCCKIITSGRKGQKAIESDKFDGGHGIFTYYLLKGLSDEKLLEDKLITIEELHVYLNNEIFNKEKVNQIPMLYRFGKKEGTWVFF